jgi:RNA polymerase sigma-70 factor (ECF subfamily)
MEQTEDAVLVEAVLAGNSEAYALLVNRYKRQIYNLAYRMTLNSETARDLSQETFVRAYTNLHRYRRERNFFTWLYTICINLTRNHLAKKREILSENTCESAVCEGFSSSTVSRSPELQMIEQQDIRGLETALSALPEDLREVLVLRYLQELPFEAVAASMSISLGAAKMRVYRGLEKLREIMAGQRDAHEN